MIKYIYTHWTMTKVEHDFKSQEAADAFIKRAHTVSYSIQKIERTLEALEKRLETV